MFYQHILFIYANVVDMFPSTDSAKNAVDMFPRTESSKDIRSVLSSHVERVIGICRVDT